METIIAIFSIGVLLMTAFFLIRSSVSKNNYVGRTNGRRSCSSNEEIKDKFRQLNRMATQIRI